MRAIIEYRSEIFAHDELAQPAVQPRVPRT